MPKYITATPALCGDGVTLSGEEGPNKPFIYDTLEEAQADVDEEETLENELYLEEVEQNAEGDWIGVESGKNWSEVARNQ